MHVLQSVNTVSSLNTFTVMEVLQGLILLMSISISTSFGIGES